MKYRKKKSAHILLSTQITCPLSSSLSVILVVVADFVFWIVTMKTSFHDFLKFRLAVIVHHLAVSKVLVNVDHFLFE